MVRPNKARLVGHSLNEKELRNKVESSLEKFKSKCSPSQYLCILKLIKDGHLNVFYKPSQKGSGNLRCNNKAPKYLREGFANLSNEIGQIMIDLLFEDRIMFEQIFPGVKRDDKLVKTATSIRDELIGRELQKLVRPIDKHKASTLLTTCKASVTFVLIVGSVVCVAILESMYYERNGVGRS